MKNRKRIIVAFMLIAVMLLGIGYAALTDTLTIIGNAHIDTDVANATFDEKIYFFNAEATSSTGTGTKDDVAACTDDDATFTANKLAVVGETSVFTFTIKNDSNVDAEISVNATKLSGADNPSNSNEEKFDVTYAYPDGMNIAKQGGTITVVVTVTVKEPVTSATSATFGIELTATSVDP
ncbi:MAG: hypothetical protein IJA86_00030 [Clostridia bacterium]|nr:hypothetical protein [Clostridia bacterium]